MTNDDVDDGSNDTEMTGVYLYSRNGNNKYHSESGRSLLSVSIGYRQAQFFGCYNDDPKSHENRKGGRRD